MEKKISKIFKVVQKFSTFNKFLSPKYFKFASLEVISKLIIDFHLILTLLMSIREYRRSFRNSSNTDRNEIPEPKINKTKNIISQEKKTLFR